MIDSNGNEGGTVLVNVPVPLKVLPDVYGFISRLYGPASGPESVAVEPTSPEEGDEWPRDLIVRQYQESQPAMKRFLDHLTAHPDVWISTLEMADALDAAHGWNTIAGMLGAYGRRVKNRYRRSTFPFEVKWDYDANRSNYRMSSEVAKIIRSLA